MIKKTYQSSFLMIVKEKLPSRFEEHTLQFTLKIALNIEMQSNLFKLCQRSGKPGTRLDSISIWLHEKDGSMFVGKFDLLFFSREG